MRHAIRSVLFGLGFLAGVGAAPAAAQTLGTFTWQLQPFCNRVVVTVTQDGALYHVDGYDDQCGAGQRAPLVGLATPNPDGSIGFGLNIVTVPGGRNVHVDARIAVATLSGSWSDSAGNSGTYAYNGAAAGSPRPAPTVPGVVIAAGTLPPTAIANNSITSTQIQNNSITSASTSNEPGVAFSYYNAPSIDLGAAPASIVSTSMRVPANGYVKVDVTGSFYQSDTTQAECQIQKGAVAAINFSEPAFFLRSGSSSASVFSAQRVFPVAVADNPVTSSLGQNFRLVCGGSNANSHIRSVHIIATYVASSYEPIVVVLPLDTTPPTPQQ